MAALPYPKRTFKPRGPYAAPRNPTGRRATRFVRLRLGRRKRVFGR